MAHVGIAIPFQANGRGGLLLLTGGEQMRKIIFTRLSDCESSNPYQQDIGIGADMIFAINDESLQAELRRRIDLNFSELRAQGRARLLKPPLFKRKSETQELEVLVQYLDMETNKPEEVKMIFSASEVTGG